jgi:uncharacterized RDD family membrane protein YckC
MAFCTACGSQLNEGMRFCQQCGRPVSSEQSAAPPMPPTPEAPPAYAAPAAYTPPPTYAATPVPPVIPAPRYAGFWLRFVANLIDGLIIGIPATVIFGICFMASGGLALLSGLKASPDQNVDPATVIARLAPLFAMYAIFFLVSMILGWLYFAGMESSARQATLGKSAISLRVTDAKGSRMTFGHASGRYFAKIITNLVPLGVGWMLAGFTARKQALHDLIAGTLVYRDT